MALPLWVFILLLSFNGFVDSITLKGELEQKNELPARHTFQLFIILRVHFEEG